VEQATELFIVPSGTGVWWPQLDDGIYLPNLLEERSGSGRSVAA
jgi:hypothetical protein